MKPNLRVTSLIVTLFLLLPELLKSQVHSTVIIDSLELRIGERLLYVSHQSRLSLVSTDKAISVYNDGIYKLLIVPEPQHAYDRVVNFYRNDTLLPLVQKHVAADYKHCQDIYLYQYLYEYQDPGKQAPSKTQIKLCYRHTTFLPEDTAHYTRHYREGIWTGKTFQGAVMRVTYHEDQKHGVATVLDRDSLLYETNFSYNVVLDYNEVTVTNLRNGRKQPASYRIYEILNSCYSAATNTYPSFSFVKKRRSKQIFSYDNLSVYYTKSGLLHDSISYRVVGDFKALIRDTMIIANKGMELHNFYKPYTDSLHSFRNLNMKGVVKIPVKDITKVYRDRNLVQMTGSTTALLAFYSALLVAPLVSIQKGGFNTERYGTVALSSLGVLAGSITTMAVFGQKKYVMRSAKHKRTWTIRPEEEAD